MALLSVCAEKLQPLEGAFYASGVRIHRCKTTMLLCPAIRMMVKTSTPDSPSPVSIVCRREWSTKSARKDRTALPFDLWRASIPVQTIDGSPQVGFALPVGKLRAQSYAGSHKDSRIAKTEETIKSGPLSRAIRARLDYRRDLLRKLRALPKPDCLVP